MARTIGTITTRGDFSETIIGEVRTTDSERNESHAVPFQMYSPPKYEEAIKSHANQEENYAPPPYTPLLSSS